MIDLFKNMGVTAVDTVGTPFNPEVHDAIMRVDSTDIEDGLVVNEFRKGFQLGEKLLRPAMVSVYSIFYFILYLGQFVCV